MVVSSPVMSIPQTRHPSSLVRSTRTSRSPASARTHRSGRRSAAGEPFGPGEVVALELEVHEERRELRQFTIGEAAGVGELEGLVEFLVGDEPHEFVRLVDRAGRRPVHDRSTPTHEQRSGAPAHHRRPTARSCASWAAEPPHRRAQGRRRPHSTMASAVPGRAVPGASAARTVPAPLLQEPLAGREVRPDPEVVVVQVVVQVVEVAAPAPAAALQAAVRGRSSAHASWSKKP